MIAIVVVVYLVVACLWLATTPDDKRNEWLRFMGGKRWPR